MVAVMGKEQEEQEEEQEEGKEPNAQSATLTPHSHFDRRNFEPKSTKQNSDSALVAAVSLVVGGDEFAHGSLKP